MDKPPFVVMTSPLHYEIAYTINPWMHPEEWARDPERGRQRAEHQWRTLAEALQDAGLALEVVPAAPGLPDLVFPANAAVVLNGRALLARFRYPERQGEEPLFATFFEDLARRGLLSQVGTLPRGVWQEGAGDCIWDDTRQVFWAGYGPRSSSAALDHLRRFFGVPVIGLELVTERFYHLDTCFAALPGGELLYYPDALSAAARATLAALVPEQRHLRATADEAAAFSLNAVAVGRRLIMARPPPRLHYLLEQRGYQVQPVELSAFMMSGGAAYCMTLRLDRRSRRPARLAAE